MIFGRLEERDVGLLGMAFAKSKHERQVSVDGEVCLIQFLKRHEFRRDGTDQNAHR
jgi:hypothetical protein